MARRKYLRPPVDFTVKLSTGKWTYVLTPIHGMAIYPQEPTVYVEPCRETKDRLNTFCHETLHTALPDMTEKEVDRVAGDLAEVLWRAGYRRRPT